jgi:hypothetical protein
LAAAEAAGFNVLISCDQSLSYQQKPDRPSNFHSRPGDKLLGNNQNARSSNRAGHLNNKSRLLCEADILRQGTEKGPPLQKPTAHTL